MTQAVNSIITLIDTTVVKCKFKGLAKNVSFLGSLGLIYRLKEMMRLKRV